MRRNHPHPPKKHNQKTSADNTLTGIGKQQQQKKKNK